MLSAPQAGKTSILVADDDGPFRSLAALVLRGAGYTVQEAKDGTEALAKCAESPFEMLLLDIRMPGASGWEVLREVVRRREGAGKGPRVLLIAEVRRILALPPEEGAP
jgi:CheY-like chemotaxis protein